MEKMLILIFFYFLLNKGLKRRWLMKPKNVVRIRIRIISFEEAGIKFEEINAKKKKNSQYFIAKKQFFFSFNYLVIYNWSQKAYVVILSFEKEKGLWGDIVFWEGKRQKKKGEEKIGNKGNATLFSFFWFINEIFWIISCIFLPFVFLVFFLFFF